VFWNGAREVRVTPAAASRDILRHQRTPVTTEVSGSALIKATGVIGAAAFGTLAISFWPYMIPFSITIEEAASPYSALAFMFWGEGIFVFR
jgi:cytochrome bd-type quinol oxidase subunit 2